MPEDTSETVEDDNEQTPKFLRRELADAKKAEQAALERAAQVEKQMAFMQAGIDPDDTRQSYFVKGYEGEMTKEAIKEAATKAGFLEAETPQVPDNELQAHQEMATVTAGAQTVPPNREAEYQAALAQARTPEDAMKVFTQFGVATTTETGGIQ